MNIKCKAKIALFVTTVLTMLVAYIIKIPFTALFLLGWQSLIIPFLVLVIWGFVLWML